MNAARVALEMYQNVSGLTSTELTGDADRDADLTFAESSSAGTTYAYFPSSGDWGGDSWFNTTLVQFASGWELCLGDHAA